jgi:hypothetical protein
MNTINYHSGITIMPPLSYDQLPVFTNMISGQRKTHAGSLPKKRYIKKNKMTHSNLIGVRDLPSLINVSSNFASDYSLIKKNLVSSQMV